MNGQIPRCGWGADEVTGAVRRGGELLGCVKGTFASMKHRKQKKSPHVVTKRKKK